MSASSAKKSADYGPVPVDAESDIRRAMETALKDAESARYQFGTPYKARAWRGLIYGGGYMYGHAVDFLVNAKNSYGGYVGFQPWQAFFTEGKVYVNKRGVMDAKKVE